MDFTLNQQTPSNKLSGFAFVVLFHVVLVYALATGLIRNPLQAPTVIEDILVLKPKDEPKEIIKEKEFDVKASKPTFQFPPMVMTDFKFNEHAITDITNVAPPRIDIDDSNQGKKGNPVHVPHILPAIVNAKACERPDYPPAAIRDNREGVTTLAFLIGTNGRVVDAKIEKSSGSKDLDKSAIAGLSRCAFKPGTVDGIAQQSWTKLEYVWRLEE